MKYLIVTADDCGLAPSIDEGIMMARREGIVTEVSLVACGGAFDGAAAALREAGIREVGAHLALTAFTPLTLPNPFPGRHRFFLRLLAGHLDTEALRRECRAQLDRITAAGFEITHLDSHEHVHMLPGMPQLFIALAKERGIPAIRFLDGIRPAGGTTLYRALVASWLGKTAAPSFRASGLFFPRHLAGFLESGRLTEPLLVEMLRSLPDGVTELVCHPAFLSPEVLSRYPWHRNGEDEIFALTGRPARRLIDAEGIRLIAYKDALGL